MPYIYTLKRQTGPKGTLKILRDYLPLKMSSNWRSCSVLKANNSAIALKASAMASSSTCSFFFESVKIFC